MPKTLEDWVAKGWTEADIAPGESVEVYYATETMDINVKRQAYDVDGQQIKGKGHPKVKVDHNDTGSTITTDAAETVTVLYRIVDEEADEE